MAADEGLLGSDNAGAGAALGISCRFTWASNSSDSSVVLEPVGLGALAVDVSAAAATAITVAEVEVTVQIDCPLGAGHEQLHLEARTQLPVVQPLQLLAPTIGACAAVVDTVSLLVGCQLHLESSKWGLHVCAGATSCTAATGLHPAKVSPPGATSWQQVLIYNLRRVFFIGVL
ncbi:unnamed protein product [Symbiodinium pilosum]|uniref:Uncharacterized protein n=1 Tax=Symbiodinium pilosum TaxID=2952 RepID=A0A812R1I3_SYMPI|nr:unnamed protein product [Symbiodinium pilosum]